MNDPNQRWSALTAPLRQPSAIGSGKISSSPFSDPSKMARATDSGRPSVCPGFVPYRVHGAGQDHMYAHGESEIWFAVDCTQKVPVNHVAFVSFTGEREQLSFGELIFYQDRTVLKRICAD